nr:hypothetical protein [Nitrosomonas nitrosa]
MRLSEKQAREFILLFAQNNHETLKTVWIVIMGAAVSNAASYLSTTLSCDTAILGLASTPSSDCTGQPSLAQSALFFLAFMLIFLRFFWGDNRYVDWKYSQAVSLTSSAIDQVVERDSNQNASALFRSALRGYSSNSQALDIYFLIAQSIIFALLAGSIVDPARFQFLFIALLCVNIAWLVLGIISPRDHTQGFFKQVSDEAAVEALRSRLPAYVWILNNLVAIGLLTFVAPHASIVLGDARAPGESAAIALWVVVMLNNLVSLTLAHHFYFPNPVNIYDDLHADQPGAASTPAEPDKGAQTASPPPAPAPPPATTSSADAATPAQGAQAGEP